MNKIVSHEGVDQEGETAELKGNKKASFILGKEDLDAK